MSAEQRKLHNAPIAVGSWPTISSLRPSSEPEHAPDPPLALSDYLPLGCLYFENLESSDDDDVDEWREVMHLQPLAASATTISSHLQKLILARWIRAFYTRSRADCRILLCRIYVLPFDISQATVDRSDKSLRTAFNDVVADLDVSPEAWNGYQSVKTARKFDPWATPADGSLFWLFNNVPSPSPHPELFKERYTRQAIDDILEVSHPLAGMKTPLYPYQARTAGLMLQRETQPGLELDPELEKRTALDGSTFYYNPREFSFYRQPGYFETRRGGILAETMGLGKTVICLALVVATKDHPPRPPVEHCSISALRKSTASLADMAIASVIRNGIPWKVALDQDHRLEGGRRKLEAVNPTYDIPLPPTRWNRKTVEPPPKRMVLASTTVIVVPRNLFRQWQSEIEKHVNANLLSILLMDSTKTPLPPPEQLIKYDVTLFTRPRFEAEIRDGSDDKGRRIGTTQRSCRCPYIGATRTRDCVCIRPDELYQSPLKLMHFKRLIIDEGHFFSNSNNRAVSVANKLITADSRWVVSGTPAKDLLGVEVDIASAEHSKLNNSDSRHDVLQLRRQFDPKDDVTGAIRNISSLATNFLKIEPWASGLNWDDYMYRHENLHRRTFSGFSTCLARQLNAMVVKTQPADVEKDMELPPLSQKIVRLEPSFYDKLTANLFVLVLTANAITSERTDVDYIFHKNSQKARSQLIGNLRQSAFCWTGFSEADVRASIASSNGYLAKENTNCSRLDRQVLTKVLDTASSVLHSKGWRSLSRSHELGIFVQDWPADSADHWAFDKARNPLMTGLSQVLEAQRHVNERIGQDPSEGLSGVGIKATAPAKRPRVLKGEEPKEETVMAKSGIPASSIDGEPVLRRRSVSGDSPQKGDKSWKTSSPQKRKRSQDEDESPSATQSTQTQDPLAIPPTLAPDSPFASPRIIGTTSAKLTYLISQILKYYKQEKILVFYDSENAAWYIAQMLDLLHIRHEIYAKSLAANLKSEYVVRFDQEPEDRVLLMDIRTAAYGLNIPSASRIFFINPPCRPNIEAQAIKRAHRIGQTRPVYVETLVLSGTIEEKMLDRSSRMTVSEHRDAGHLEDDTGIRNLIQNAQMMQLTDAELKGNVEAQIARLEVAEQLFGREGYHAKVGRQEAGHGATPRKRQRKGNGEVTSKREIGDAMTLPVRNASPIVEIRHGG